MVLLRHRCNKTYLEPFFLRVYSHVRLFFVACLYSHEIRDAHLVEESVMEVLKSKADFRSFKPRPFNMWEFYNRTGHDIKDMLLSCQYRGVPCRPEDFSVVRNSRDAQ